MELLTEHNRKIIANRLFYLALLIELVLMIVEKSEVIFSGESYVFRVTFLLTFLAVIITSHDMKEWAIITAVWVFTFVCYRITGRNELLRFATFVMAARNINLGKTMKMTFWCDLVGFAAIVLLSVTGIMGSVSAVADYGRDSGEELRYVLGFGHPNALWGCAYALMLLWIWVYGSRAKIWAYGILLMIIGVLYKITVSRTSFIIGLFTFALALLVRYVPRFKSRKYAYVLAVIVSPVLCMAFSIWAAIISPIPRYIHENKYYKQITWLDELLNNRMHNLYRANEKHAGALETWKLFSDSQSVEYFDMGWVRLYYWYGIIPATLICILLIVFIYKCYKRRDAWTMVIFISMSIYTVIEATFVSVYIGRNMLLPIMGVYLFSEFERNRSNNVIKG